MEAGLTQLNTFIVQTSMKEHLFMLTITSIRPRTTDSKWEKQTKLQRQSRRGHNKKDWPLISAILNKKLEAMDSQLHIWMSHYAVTTTDCKQQLSYLLKNMNHAYISQHLHILLGWALLCKQQSKQCLFYKLTYPDYQLQCSIRWRMVSEQHGDKERKRSKSTKSVSTKHWSITYMSIFVCLDAGWKMYLWSFQWTKSHQDKMYLHLKYVDTRNVKNLVHTEKSRLLFVYFLF